LKILPLYVHCVSLHCTCMSVRVATYYNVPLSPGPLNQISCGDEQLRGHMSTRWPLDHLFALLFVYSIGECICKQTLHTAPIWSGGRCPAAPPSSLSCQNWMQPRVRTKVPWFEQFLGENK
jgi:hypothetical protein